MALLLWKRTETSFKRWFPFVAALFFAALPLCAGVRAAGNETYIYHADSVNGTRWADTLVVYRGLEKDGQNEWGYNVLVDGAGVVIGKIPAGDAKGKNLAVPQDGLIISGTGDIGKEVYARAEIGGKAFFDDYSMNVYLSAGEPDPYYTYAVRATHFNGVRYAGRLVIYDRSGERTGTNVYGYEVCVSGEGRIISAGGNDNLVPQGGYVLSAIEPADRTALRTYFQVGAHCERNGLDVTVTYDRDCLEATFGGELALLSQEIQKAKDQLRLVDYDSVSGRYEALLEEKPRDIPHRNALISEVKALTAELIERRTVEVRAVWYRPTETAAAQIAETVAEMAKCGINELVLDATVKDGSLASLPEGSPFRVSPVTRRLDVIGEYIAQCREQGIRITLLVPVMSNNLLAAGKHSEWYLLRSDGTAGDERFYSPANSEYRSAFTDYVKHILTHYDIDGLQLDFIRYPYYDGSADYGYDAASAAAFCERSGCSDEDFEELRVRQSSHRLWNEWQSFKCGLISGWVEEIYGICSGLRPDTALSAAVAATGGVRAYCQDAAEWVRGGYVDALYVMSYAEGVNEQSTSPFKKAFSETGCLVMGCGAYLSLTESDVLSDTSSSGLCFADGISYFEWSAYKAHGFADLLEGTLFSGSALHFFGDTAEVRSALIESAKARFALAGKTDAGTLTAESGAEEIRAVMHRVRDERNYAYLTQDLERALRVIGTAKAPRGSNGSEQSADEASDAQESAAEEISEQTSESAESVPSGTGFGNGGKIALAAGIFCAAVAVCAAVIVLVKKKKK